MTNSNGNLLAKWAMGLSGLAITAAGVGLVQWGAWGADLTTVQKEQQEFKKSIKAIEKDVNSLKTEVRVQGIILRDVARKLDVYVPDPQHDDD